MNIYQQIMRKYKLLCQVIPELFLYVIYYSSHHPEWGEELDGVVDDLDPAEDREASEEPHRSSDEAKLGFQGHLLVLFNFVICCYVEEDLDEVDLSAVWRG